MKKFNIILSLVLSAHSMYCSSNYNLNNTSAWKLNVSIVKKDGTTTNTVTVNNDNTTQNISYDKTDISGVKISPVLPNGTGPAEKIITYSTGSDLEAAEAIAFQNINGETDNTKSKGVHVYFYSSKQTLNTSIDMPASITQNIYALKDEDMTVTAYDSAGKSLATLTLTKNNNAYKPLVYPASTQKLVFTTATSLLSKTFIVGDTAALQTDGWLTNAKNSEGSISFGLWQMDWSAKGGGLTILSTDKASASTLLTQTTGAVYYYTSKKSKILLDNTFNGFASGAMDGVDIVVVPSAVVQARPIDFGNIKDLGLVTNNFGSGDYTNLKNSIDNRTTINALGSDSAGYVFNKNDLTLIKN